MQRLNGSFVLFLLNVFVERLFHSANKRVFWQDKVPIRLFSMLPQGSGVCGWQWNRLKGQGLLCVCIDCRAQIGCICHQTRTQKHAKTQYERALNIVLLCVYRFCEDACGFSVLYGNCLFHGILETLFRSVHVAMWRCSSYCNQKNILQGMYYMTPPLFIIFTLNIVTYCCDKGNK